MTTTTLEPVKVIGADAPEAEWLAARATLGISATRMTALAGLNPYKGALEVYHELIGDPFPDTAGEAAEIGLILEDPVARMWARRENRRVVKAGLYQNPEVPWCIATPDRLVLKGNRPFTSWDAVDGVLEAKTALGWSALDWDDETVPDQHLVQVTWQLAATGLARGWIVALAGPSLKSYLVERDDTLIGDLMTIGERFLEDNVAKRIPPAPDGNSRLTDLIRAKWQADPDKVEVLDPAEFLPFREAYAQAAADEKAAKIRKTAAGDAIRYLLKEAEQGVIDSEPVVTWREAPRAGYVVEPTVTRTLRFPKAKRSKA